MRVSRGDGALEFGDGLVVCEFEEVVGEEWVEGVGGLEWMVVGFG